MKKRNIIIPTIIGAGFLFAGIGSVQATVDKNTYLDCYQVESARCNFVDSNIAVTDESGELLFISDAKIESVYTTDYVNVRTGPSINAEIFTTAPIGTKILRVGSSKEYGWDIVQIDNRNYFMWNDYLTTECDEPYAPLTYDVEPAADESLTYLGDYELTAYYNPNGNLTASGTDTVVNHTIAADNIPFGTQLSINGQTYTVEDCGVGNDYTIDIYMETYDECIEFGRKYDVPVYIVNN